MRNRTEKIRPFGSALLVLTGLFLGGCSSSGDGEMLSDAEKIEKTHQGRAEYEKAMQNGAPSTAGGASTSK